MHTPGQTRPLSDLTGEELLLRAIAGRPRDQLPIQRELSLRAVLAEEGRRFRSAESRPNLRIAHGHAA